MAARRKKEAAPARAASSAPVRRATRKQITKAKSEGNVSAAARVADVFNKAKTLRGSVRLLGDRSHDNVDAISSGSIGLDKALGVGGFPRGRVVEVFGPESGGKTTLCLHVVANAQRAGGTVVYVDAEHAMDITYASKLGVNVDELVLVQPDYGEQGLEAVQMAVEQNVDLVVIDSVAALTPKAEIEGDYGDSAMGLHARMMSQALRKLTAIVGKSKTCVIFINQIREKIGVMFGNPETTTGGRALRFYSSQRVDIRRKGAASAGKDIGNRIRVKVVKNKIAPPFRECEFDLLFGHGVDNESEILEIAIEAGIVEQSGAWLSYGDKRLGMGHAQAINALLENPEMLNELKTKIMALDTTTEPEGNDASASQTDNE